MDKKKRLIPRWILSISWVFAIMGMLNGITAYFKPEILVMGFTSTSTATTAMAMMFAARNLAMAVGMLFALLSGTLEGLAAIYIIRVMVELQDMLVALKIGVIPMAIVAGIILVIELVIFLLLVKRIRASK